MATEVIYYGADSPQAGQVKETVNHPDPPASYKLLSATAFNKYAASQLGSGAAGMARFIKIMDDGRAAGGAAKFCVNQYDKAITFEKSEVLAFGTVLNSANCMSKGEVDAIVNNWPQE